MAGEFPDVPLGSVASVRSGFAFKSKDWVDSGIPVVKIANVKDGRLEMSGCSHVTPAVAATASEFDLRDQDILIAMTGYVGDVVSVHASDLPAVLNQRVGRFTVPDRNRVDPSFLFYFLRCPETRTTIESLGYGSAQPNVSPALIHQVEMPLPPLSEQKAIAHILGTLDAKIELNRRMNATLEEMARALFKSWFVDFDPVRAKREGRQPHGMDAATAELFPDEFDHVNGELVPGGWAIRKVGDVTHRITKGDTPRKSALQATPDDDRLIPFLRVNAITETGEVLRHKLRYIPESIHLGKSKRSILQENDVLYTNAGTIGRVSLVQRDLLPANTNQAIAIVRPNAKKVRPAFLFMLLRQPDFQAKLHCDVVQAVQANLALGKIADAEAVFPTEDSISKLIAPIESMLNNIWANRRVSQSLAATRDALLPKLLSGELRVPDAEKIAAEVT